MLINLVLVIGKFAAGVFGRSSAMIADAVHSVSDFATDLIVIVFVGISTRPRDAGHAYGHGKFETLATVVIGIALGAVGVGILTTAIQTIVAYAQGTALERPGAIALVAAGASLVAKEALFQFTYRVGKREKSPAVIANAWHHRSDALSSAGALVGIAGAFFLGEQWRVLDPAAAVLVSVLIGKAAVDLIVPGLRELLEASLPKDIEQVIEETVRGVDGVEDPHGLRTRRVGSDIAIDVHVRMDRALTVEASHRTTEEIEHRLRERFGPGTMVTVHVEPARDPVSGVTR
jgi:cation diffusion facilitator family transporter